MPSPRKKRAARDTSPALGVGSKVSEEELVKAATIWLELEGKSDSGKVSAIAVGRRLGKSVAPEWLDSTRFQLSLELVRFNQKVSSLKGIQEISNLVGRVIDLGLIEAHRRLVLEPTSIPDTVLFGDVLHKLIKLQQEVSAGAKPIKVGDVYQIVAKEIMLLADPRDQEAMRAQIMGSIQSGMKTLQASEPSSAEEDLVDVVGTPVDTPTVEPVPEPRTLPVGGPGGRVTAHGAPPVLPPQTQEEQLWSDPALD